MSATNRVWPDVAIPPGETLAEELEARGMSQSELARRMDRPFQAINEIVRGTKAITPETAMQLEAVLGVPGDFWVRLDADYRYNRARLAKNIAEAEARAQAIGHTLGRVIHRKKSGRRPPLKSTKRGAAGRAGSRSR